MNVGHYYLGASILHIKCIDAIQENNEIIVPATLCGPGLTQNAIVRENISLLLNSSHHILILSKIIPYRLLNRRY